MTLNLTAFALIFSAHSYCARKFTRHVHQCARKVKKWTKIAQMAFSIALPGFNDLGRSVTPIFLLMDHFPYRFSTFSKKMEKIYRLEVWIFCKMHDRIPLFWFLRLSVRRYQMPLERLSFLKTSAKFGIIYTTDLLLQNTTKIVSLGGLTFDILNYKPLWAMLNYVRQFF